MLGSQCLHFFCLLSTLETSQKLTDEENPNKKENNRKRVNLDRICLLHDPDNRKIQEQRSECVNKIVKQDFQQQSQSNSVSSRIDEEYKNVSKNNCRISFIRKNNTSDTCILAVMSTNHLENSQNILQEKQEINVYLILAKFNHQIVVYSCNVSENNMLDFLFNIQNLEK
ncbi:hypothetical protein EDEG_03287 [Edhazardia aedis USNM 41457]|uniref:Uncharacterized protein n=1 Tax=Edhazardia aedis (strain USNM 41457) TaxID=1003232 RepID=J9D370_EDHAE|nr:hypothetical protein EDEG_03287 [Edhazardia aedis USNM 41457]|eukprot:EJW02281.1 hypothetical protein EDEG_03287 [Edhazardia aedis USNM 41457]